MKTARNVILRVKELIGNPKHWTKGANARNSDNLPINVYDVEAVCWCLSGAIYRIEAELFNTQQHTPNGLYSTITVIMNANCIGSIIDLNDESTHEGIIAALDKTLAYLDEYEIH